MLSVLLAALAMTLPWCRPEPGGGRSYVIKMAGGFSYFNTSSGGLRPTFATYGPESTNGTELMNVYQYAERDVFVLICGTPGAASAVGVTRAEAVEEVGAEVTAGPVETAESEGTVGAAGTIVSTGTTGMPAAGARIELQVRTARGVLQWRFNSGAGELHARIPLDRLDHGLTAACSATDHNNATTLTNIQFQLLNTTGPGTGTGHIPLNELDVDEVLVTDGRPLPVSCKGTPYLYWMWPSRGPDRGPRRGRGPGARGRDDAEVEMKQINITDNVTADYNGTILRCLRVRRNLPLIDIEYHNWMIIVHPDTVTESVTECVTESVTERVTENVTEEDSDKTIIKESDTDHVLYAVIAAFIVSALVNVIVATLYARLKAETRDAAVTTVKQSSDVQAEDLTDNDDLIESTSNDYEIINYSSYTEPVYSNWPR